MLPEAVFAVLAAITLGGAVVSVAAHSIFRAALGLMVSLFGVAGLFLLQRAEFLAIVQILVYVGGVSVLIVFAIMLTEREGSQQEVTVNRGMAMPAALLGLALAGGLTAAILRAPLGDSPPAAVTAADLGAAFLGQFLVPFEAVSVLLLVAVIGALLIARDGTS